MHTHRTARLLVPLTPPGASSLTRCSLKSRRFHRSCTCRCGSCHVAGRWSHDAHCRACSHLTRLASTAAVAALPVGRFWVEQRKQLAHLFFPGKLKRRDLLCSAWFVDVGRLNSSVRSSTPRAYWMQSIVQRAEAALTPNAQVPTRHDEHPSRPHSAAREWGGAGRGGVSWFGVKGTNSRARTISSCSFSTAKYNGVLP